MAERTLLDVGIWIQGHNFAGVSNQCTFNVNADLKEIKVFDEGFMRRASGLKSSAFSLQGYFDTEGPDEFQFNSLGNEREALLAPEGDDTGDLAFVVPIAVSAHELGAEVGELLTFSYAAEGDGEPLRGQVMDVRNDITANVDQTRQDFGAIPVDNARKVVFHVTVRQGQVRIDLMSATAQTGGTLTQRAMTPNITATGRHELVVQSGMLQPVTDEWWFLRYIVGSGTNDVDVAAAVVNGHHTQIIPAPPITPPIPTPGSVSLKGGTSADTTPTAGELTIDGANHVLTIPAFTSQYLLIARLASEADITSVVLSSDPTMQNQIGAFAKFGSTVTVSGDAYNVWVSNQSLTFTADTDVEAT